MQPTWLVGSVWVMLSLTSLSFALAVVYYNTVIVLTELILLLVLRKVRHALRWVSLPLPSRWAHKRSIWKLKQRMQSAKSFEAWLSSARELDDMEGGTQWRAERASDDYDVDLIEDSVRRLRSAREQGDYPALMLALRACVHRGYAGITGAVLFQHAYTGTKVVLESFVTEICASIEAVSYASDLPLPVRTAFVDALRVQLGRTALALSGGGTLALAHLGVVRTLLCAGLLPRVISGTSGGSLVAGMMASRTDQELLDHVLVPGVVESKGKDNVFFGPPLEQMLNFIKTGRLVNNDKFIRAIRTFIGEETFLQAWRRTGRIVNIAVVARAGSAASYNLQLNYLTAPQVLIWSAVSASCALPGLMHPVMIMAQDDSGRVVPYHTQGLMTVDGSMAVDVPRNELALLFHVDTLLVSQANPHVVPFLKLSRDSFVPGGRSVGRLDANLISQALAACTLWLLLDVRHRMHLLAGLRLLPRWFGEDSGPLFAQSYTGDVTFVPHQSPLEAWRALTQPTVQDLARLILDGQRATWPHLAHVRTLVAVERKLSLCARQLAEQVRAQREGQGLPMAMAQRIEKMPGLGLTVPANKAALTPKPGQRLLVPSSVPPLSGHGHGHVEGEAEGAGEMRPLTVAPGGRGRMVRVHSYSVPSLPGMDGNGMEEHPPRGPGARGPLASGKATVHLGHANDDDAHAHELLRTAGIGQRTGPTHSVDAQLLRAAGALPSYPPFVDSQPMHSARTSIDYGQDSMPIPVPMQAEGAQEASEAQPPVYSAASCDLPDLLAEIGGYGDLGRLRGSSTGLAAAAEGSTGTGGGREAASGLYDYANGYRRPGQGRRRSGLGAAVVGLHLPLSSTSPGSACPSPSGSSGSATSSSSQGEGASAASQPASPARTGPGSSLQAGAFGCPITLGLPLGPSDVDLTTPRLHGERLVHSAVRPTRARRTREQHSPVWPHSHGAHRRGLSLKSVESSPANLFAPDEQHLGQL